MKNLANYEELVLCLIIRDCYAAMDTLQGEMISQLEESPIRDLTLSIIGGCRDAIQKMIDNPELFVFKKSDTPCHMPIVEESISNKDFTEKETFKSMPCEYGRMKLIDPEPEAI